jgi:hypothetical protein
MYVLEGYTYYGIREIYVCIREVSVLDRCPY